VIGGLISAAWGWCTRPNVVGDDDDESLAAEERAALDEIAQIMAWLVLVVPRRRARHGRLSRWITQGCERVRALVTDCCAETLAEVDDLETAIAESAELFEEAAHDIEAPARPIDRRALIRRDRVYQSTAGPPRTGHENGLDARLLSLRGGRFHKSLRAVRPGLVYIRTTRLSPENSHADNPGVFGAGFLRLAPGGAR
jgi:hypothetical protein